MSVLYSIIVLINAKHFLLFVSLFLQIYMKNALHSIWIIQSWGMGGRGGDTDGMRQSLFVDRSFSFTFVHRLHLEVFTVSRHRFFCTQCFTQSLHDSWAMMQELRCRVSLRFALLTLWLHTRTTEKICKTRRLTQPWRCFLSAAQWCWSWARKLKKGTMYVLKVLLR